MQRPTMPVPTTTTSAEAVLCGVSCTVAVGLQERLDSDLLAGACLALQWVGCTWNLLACEYSMLSLLPCVRWCLNTQYACAAFGDQVQALHTGNWDPSINMRYHRYMHMSCIGRKSVASWCMSAF
jgi:hypothetical protein